MSEYIQSLMQANPNDPFAPAAPTMTEILLRGLSGALPPPGQLRVRDTGLGRTVGTGLRLGGSLAGIIGEEMAKRRQDPLGRILPVAEQVTSALQNAQIPGQTLQVGGPVVGPPPLGLFQARAPTEFPGELPELDLPGRKAGSLAEARPLISEQDRRALAALEILYPQAVKEERLFQKPERFTVSRGQQVMEQLPGQQPKVVAQGLPEPPDLNLETRYETGKDGKLQSYQARVIYDANTKLPIGEQRIPGSERPAQFEPQRAPKTKDEIQLEQEQIKGAKLLNQIRERELKGEIDTPKEIIATISILTRQLDLVDQQSPEAAVIKSYIFDLNKRLGVGGTRLMPGQEPKTFEEYLRLRQGPGAVQQPGGQRPSAQQRPGTSSLPPQLEPRPGEFAGSETERKFRERLTAGREQRKEQTQKEEARSVIINRARELARAAGMNPNMPESYLAPYIRQAERELR